jgi:hypothetical protein
VLDLQADLVERERLLHVVAGAALHRLHGVGDGSVRGHHQDGQLRHLGEEPAEEIETAAVGKPEVEERHVRRLLRREPPRLGQGRRVAHLEATRGERLHQIPREDRFVLHDEQDRHARLLYGGADRPASRPGGNPAGGWARSRAAATTPRKCATCQGPRPGTPVAHQAPERLLSKEDTMGTKTRTGFTRGLALGVALAALGTATMADARHGSGRVREDLTATSAAPTGARGRAVVRVRNEDGRLTVVAKDVGRDTTFDVILDGVKIGTLTTSGGGNGRAHFRSRPRGHDQLLGTDPRGKMLILRSADGADVLVADIPAATDPTPDDPDDDDVVCCLPDDSGEECEDRTAAECAAQGGRNLGAGSCIPNPCDAGPAPDDVVCCLPDDSATECEDRTEAECAADGGTVVGGATSCADNPCAPIPPADPDIQCCLLDDSGTECEDRTPETCAAQGGINMGPGTCTPDPCGGVTPPPEPETRCCVPDDSGPKCEDRTAEKCAERGGTDIGSGSCDPNPCS